MLKANAIKHFKRAAYLALALGITKGYISQWGDIVPEKQALRLERLTKGALKYDPSMYKGAA